VLTDFYVFNQRIKPNSKLNGRVLLEQPVSKTKEIRLKHYENSFSFDFAALHFAAPNKNQYAYKLEGFDENWTYTNAEKPFANYTNISAGNYEFKLRVSNNDNLWTDTYESLALIVNPPFWLTPLAYVLYALCGIVILLVLRRYTIIRITEKHHLQLERLDREKSEELHQTKLQFFTNISHEFKTPLTLIIGPLEELLKKDQDNDRSIQYKLIQKNSQYLLRLVNQLIDFRKLDQGRMKLKIANGELTDFIAESCAPFQFLANKRNINYRITVPQASPPTWYDADVLEKIMNNLLSNAFKFTPEYGEISVEILFPQQAGSNPPRDVFNARKTASEEYVKILIKDSGSGIGKNKIQKIFDRFYNEGPTLNGSGIGLSFVQSLVKLHHGNIEVESKPGFGSLFTVAIPFKKESYTYDEIVDTTYEEGAPHFEPVRFFQPTEVSHLVVPQPSGETTPELPILLVVDDHSDIRAFIRRGLSDHYQIIEADNGESGYSRAIEYLPDIVVSDIVMPKMDGISLLNRLKSDKKTSHIPVLLLTAITSENTEFQGIEGGADGYITKPFRIDLLMLRIKNIMFYREQLRKRFAIDTAMQPTEVTVTSADEQFIQQAMEIVELHMMDADFTVNEFVKEIGLSRSNLYSKFKELTGMSTSEFVRSVRLKRAIHLLEKSDLSVKEVMYRTGFNTASYFTKCFKKQFGFTPSEYESSPSDKSTTEKAPHPPDYTTEKMGL
ncbi:MAG: response regulator, partial [Bacteroidota bacterium]